MGLSQENTGPLKVKKIPMYLLTRAELLYTLCNEIPCTLRAPLYPVLDYKPQILGFKIEAFPCLVHKMSVILTGA